jgi:adenine-specific DNA methylase
MEFVVPAHEDINEEEEQEKIAKHHPDKDQEHCVWARCGVVFARKLSGNRS